MTSVKSNSRSRCTTDDGRDVRLIGTPPPESPPLELWAEAIRSTTQISFLPPGTANLNNAVPAAAWDILKSHAALVYDPDGKCLYENFGHLNRG